MASHGFSISLGSTLTFTLTLAGDLKAGWRFRNGSRSSCEYSSKGAPITLFAAGGKSLPFRCATEIWHCLTLTLILTFSIRNKLLPLHHRDAGSRAGTTDGDSL